MLWLRCYCCCFGFLGLLFDDDEFVLDCCFMLLVFVLRQGRCLLLQFVCFWFDLPLLLLALGCYVCLVVGD